MNLKNSYHILKNYKQDPLGFLYRIMEEKGHRAHLNVFGRNLFIISSPEDVIHVLKTNDKNYSKGRTTQMLRSFLGNGLITNEGESWKEHHRQIRPMMNFRNIIQFRERIEKVVRDFVSNELQRNELNLFQKMNRLTWNIVLQTLFSEEITPSLLGWLDEIQELMEIITRKTRSSIPLPFWVPTQDNQKLKQILKKFDEHVFGMIENRKKNPGGDDLLQHLINLKTLSDEEIRDEIMTFMMAGHETITNSMAWTIIELGKNRQHIEKIFEELKVNDLMEAKHLGLVINEGLRFWPPVWVFMRSAKDWDQIGELKIPPKSNVVLAVYNSHHSKDLWESPEEFKPERFEEEINPGAFYPFGLGPRACIGASFANIEARIILGEIIKNFSWEIREEEKQQFHPGISLRPLNNLDIVFRKR